MVDPNLKKAVMDRIGFTLEDLSANQEGRLSQEQRLRLFRKRKFWRNGCIAALGGGIVVCILAVLGLISGGEMTSRRIAYVIMAFLITAIAVMVTGYRWKCFDADAKTGTVSSVQGALELDSSSTHGSDSYTVTLGSEWFGVSERVFLGFERLQSDEPYCTVYYAPNSKTILSVEPLRDGE